VTNQYSRNREEEVSRTIDKVDAGAEFIVTNVAFDETCVLDHIDNLKGQGLDVPILTQVSIASSLANLHYVSHRFDIPLSSTVLAKMARRDDPHPGRSLAVQTYKVLRDQTDGVHFSYLLRTRNPIPSYHQLLEEIGVGPRVTETILEASKVHIKTNN
jgi:methylenetetrahydrofolate reductase (NADPH)